MLLVSNNISIYYERKRKMKRSFVAGIMFSSAVATLPAFANAATSTSIESTAASSPTAASEQHSVPESSSPSVKFVKKVSTHTDVQAPKTSQKAKPKSSFWDF